MDALVSILIGSVLGLIIAIFFAGIFLFCRQKTKLPAIILAIICGILANASVLLFSSTFFLGCSNSCLVFPSTLALGFALSLSVLYSCRHFRIKFFDSTTRLIGLYLFCFILAGTVSFVLLTNAFYSLFSIVLIIFLAVILMANEWGSIAEGKHRILRYLHDESILSLGLVIVIFSLFFGVYRNAMPFNLGIDIFSGIKQVAFGLAIGLVFGIIALGFLRKRLSYFLLFAGLILAYFSSEMLSASGIAATLVYSLMFANVTLNKKHHLAKSVSKVDDISLMLLILIIAFIDMPKITMSIIGISLSMYLIYFLIRLVFSSLFFTKLPQKEQLLFALQSPKATLAIVLAVALVVFEFPNANSFLECVLIIAFVSAIVSFISIKNSKYFLGR